MRNLLQFYNNKSKAETSYKSVHGLIILVLELFRGNLFIILLISFWVENQSLEKNPPIRDLSIFEYPRVTILSVYFQLLVKCLIELTPSSIAYIKRHSFKIIYPITAQTVAWTLSRTTSVSINPLQTSTN